MPPQIRFEELWLVSLPKSLRSMRAVLTPLDDNAAAATEPLIPPPMISTSNASDSNFWICSFRSDISKVLNDPLNKFLSAGFVCDQGVDDPSADSPTNGI